MFCVTFRFVPGCLKYISHLLFVSCCHLILSTLLNLTSGPQFITSNISMTVATTTSVALTSRVTSAKVAQAAALGLRLTHKPLSSAPRVSCLLARRDLGERRQFSTTRPTQLKAKQWFPPPEHAPKIEYAGPAWPHPVYAGHPLLCIKAY